MNSGLTWKLHKGDETIEEFIDIRRKVGNLVIRDYLLDHVVNLNSVVRIPGKLRGPKNEFKDFAKFLILQLSIDKAPIQFLAEAGVFENLRIVAVDTNNLAARSSEDLINIFTNALEHPEQFDTKLVLSDDSTVR